MGYHGGSSQRSDEKQGRSLVESRHRERGLKRDLLTDSQEKSKSIRVRNSSVTLLAIVSSHIVINGAHSPSVFEWAVAVPSSVLSS